MNGDMRMAGTPQAYYSITKIQDNGNGTSTYRLTYRLDDGSQSLVQKNRLVITKEDTDGTKSSTSVDIKASSLASFANPSASEATTDRVNGFSVNLSDSNLAIGGTYYEIDGFVGTYSGSSQTSSSSEFEGEIASGSSNSGPIIGPIDNEIS